MTLIICAEIPVHNRTTARLEAVVWLICLRIIWNRKISGTERMGQLMKNGI